MLIGQLAHKTGLSKDTIRYYEKIGLFTLSKNQRGENNYRIYDEVIFQRIMTIQKMKAFGFTLNEIKDMLDFDDHGILACGNVTNLINDKLEKIEKQIALLQSYKNKLLMATQICQGNCKSVMENL